LALALASAVAMAQAPLQGTQVPGYYRLAVGDYEVTALFDGYNDLSPKLLQGMTQDQVRALLARRSIETPGVQTAFNAFLVNTGKQLIPVAPSFASAPPPGCSRPTCVPLAIARSRSMPSC
jgi:hypothetical protein